MQSMVQYAQSIKGSSAKHSAQSHIIAKRCVHNTNKAQLYNYARKAHSYTKEREDRESKKRWGMHVAQCDQATMSRDADAAQLIDSALNFIERFHLLAVSQVPDHPRRQNYVR